MTDSNDSPANTNDQSKEKSCDEQAAKCRIRQKIKALWRKLPFEACRKEKPRVAVLRLAGVIGQVGAMRKGLNLDELDADINKAFDFEPDEIKAVAVQVNSPGGSPVQSELIFNHIRRMAEKKKIPVYTFAEDVAASGGYWLLCLGDEVYASENSVVGSIGVISSGFGFVEAIRKLGVERRVHIQGENKSILDPFQEEKEEDIRLLSELQKDVHDSFKALVRSRRGSKIKKSDEKLLFSGAFWTGKKALELGLIDGLGDMRSIMTEKFGPDVKYIKISKPQSWLRRKLGMSTEMVLGSAIRVVEERAWWSRFGA